MNHSSEILEIAYEKTVSFGLNLDSCRYRITAKPERETGLWPSCKTPEFYSLFLQLYRN